MAGEWIKMRTNLWSDPRVSQLCDLTDKTKPTIIGALYWMWASADEHTETGHMPGLSTKGIDRDTGIKGFGKALVTIGWIEDTPEGITLLRFSEHNGASAKTRATTAKRVANHTAKSKSDGSANEELTPDTEKTNGASVSLPLAREEKNKEDKTNAPAAPAFDPLVELKARGVSDQTAADWLRLRKSKRAVVTITALKDIIAEAGKAGLPLERALSISCRRGWTGFEASWLKDSDLAAPAPPTKPDWI